MNLVKRILGHLKTITVHRWFVFCYCCKYGMPFRGMMHDISKYSFTEFWESVKYYSGTRSPIDACKEANGFSKAWLHHKSHNPHHYEYWTDNYDRGTTSVCMPFKYTLEMFCDYLGAGKAYNKGKYSFIDSYNWWTTHRDSRKAMHPVQKEFLNQTFLYLLKYNKLPSKKYLQNIYNTVKQEYENTNG